MDRPAAEKEADKIFFFYTVFLVLTAYNPFLVKLLVPKFNFENEYYRFFWILPVIPAVAYYCVRLVCAVKNKAGKAAVALGLAVVIVVTGTPLNGVVQNFALAENIYKVPNDLRAACDIIHANTKRRYPRVVFDANLNTTARQYDPSLKLVLNRDAVLYRAGSNVAGTISEDNFAYQRMKTIMDVTYYGLKVPRKEFRRALKETRTNFLVLPVTLTNHKFIRKAGCKPIAQTENYVIYRFNWKRAVIH